MVKVYVGSVIWREVAPLHMKSLLSVLVDPRYAYYPQVGDALVERARGISASYFLRHTDADVHLSIDSDIVEFQKKDIDQLCEQAEEYGIVGGVYICRSAARTFPATFFEDETPIEFAFDPSPQPVKWLATGLMAVHRRVFEAMAGTLPLLHERDGARAFYPFYQTLIHDGGDEIGQILLSEDYAFCQRAKELGFQSYVNPAIRVGHVGPYVYRLEDMAQTVLQPQPMKITRSGPYWKTECAQVPESPESLGRTENGNIPERFNRAERRRHEKEERKALTPVTGTT